MIFHGETMTNKTYKLHPLNTDDPLFILMNFLCFWKEPPTHTRHVSLNLNLLRFYPISLLSFSFSLLKGQNKDI